MRRRVDQPSLAAGLVVCALGVVLLLDATGAIDLSVAALGPILAAAAGVVLLASGLSRPR